MNAHYYYFRNRDEARLTIFEYIEVYYNRQRRHASLSWMTPYQYKESNKNRVSNNPAGRSAPGYSYNLEGKKVSHR